MDASSQIVSVKDNLLLAGLSEPLRMQMESNLPVESYAAGEVLFRQGDPAKTIGLIIEGTLMVSRGEGDQRVELAMLEAGDWFGSASISTRVRSATITAQTPARIAVLRVQDTWRTLSKDANWDAIQQVLVNVMQEQNSSLIRSNDQIATQVRRQLRAGRAVAVLISLMAIYAYFLRSFPTTSGRTMEALSLTIAFLAAGGGLLFMRTSQLPAVAFGLTLRGLGPALWAALRWSVLTCAGFTLLKAMIPAWRAGPLITVPQLGVDDLLWLGVYLLSALVQEFAARSFLHTVFEQLFAGENHHIRAILMSNLVFSVFHLHYTPVFAVTTFLVGLLYGVFWVRHRNLLAISVFHWITGVWALDVLMLLTLPGLTPG